MILGTIPDLRSNTSVLQRVRDDGIKFRKYFSKMSGYFYMMSNLKNGPIYSGVTADLGARVYQHRNGEGSKFCNRYGLTRLIYCEQYDRIEDAIAREKQIKKWRRSWKIKLIEEMNPNWDDLFPTLNL